MAQIGLNLENSETYICFKNNEGIFVFNRMTDGAILLDVNEHQIATGLTGHANLELSGFSFGELCPQIDLVREMKAKIDSLNENEVETLNNILG